MMGVNVCGLLFGIKQRERLQLGVRKVVLVQRHLRRLVQGGRQHSRAVLTKAK